MVSDDTPNRSCAAAVDAKVDFLEPILFEKLLQHRCPIPLNGMTPLKFQPESRRARCSVLARETVWRLRTVGSGCLGPAH